MNTIALSSAEDILARNRTGARAAASLIFFWGDKCHYCGIELNDNNRTIDHLYPMIRGGSKRRIDNRRLACADCNFLKNCMTPNEFSGAVVTSILKMAWTGQKYSQVDFKNLADSIFHEEFPERRTFPLFNKLEKPSFPKTEFGHKVKNNTEFTKINFWISQANDVLRMNSQDIDWRAALKERIDGLNILLNSEIEDLKEENGTRRTLR
jgi:hypothetical protein